MKAVFDLSISMLIILIFAVVFLALLIIFIAMNLGINFFDLIGFRI